MSSSVTGKRGFTDQRALATREVESKEQDKEVERNCYGALTVDDGELPAVEEGVTPRAM